MVTRHPQKSVRPLPIHEAQLQDIASWQMAQTSIDHSLAAPIIDSSLVLAEIVIARRCIQFVQRFNHHAHHSRATVPRIPTILGRLSK
jgi:hypothetical protein